MSDSRLGKNLVEAREAYKKARKFTEKTLTRWKPDWEQAARFYRDAIKALRPLGDAYSKELISYYHESAIAHEQINSFQTAASDMEAAANLAAKTIDRAETAKAIAADYVEASRYFRLNSSNDKGALMLVKAAETITPYDTEAAYQHYLDACSVFEDNDRALFSDNAFKKTIIFCVKQERFSDAIEIMKRQNIQYRKNITTFEKDYFQNNLSIVILYLYLDDLENASKFHEEADAEDKRYSRSQDYETAYNLISSFENGDEEEFEKAIKSQAIKYLVNAVAVLARKMKMPKKRIKKRANPAAASSSSSSSSSSSAAAGKKSPAPVLSPKDTKAEKKVESEDEEEEEEHEEEEEQETEGKKAKPAASAAAAPTTKKRADSEDEEEDLR